MQDRLNKGSNFSKREFDPLSLLKMRWILGAISQLTAGRMKTSI
jgi:hypothetical protein